MNFLYIYILLSIFCGDGAKRSPSAARTRFAFLKRWLVTSGHDEHFDVINKIRAGIQKTNARGVAFRLTKHLVLVLSRCLDIDSVRLPFQTLSRVRILAILRLRVPRRGSFESGNLAPTLVLFEQVATNVLVRRKIRRFARGPRSFQVIFAVRY